MKNDIKNLFLIIRNDEDLFSSFATLSSFIKNQKERNYCIYLFLLVEIPPDIQEEFLNLSGDIKLVFYELMNKKISNNRLNLIFYILRNFTFSGPILYLSNACIILSDISALFAKKAPILAKKEKECCCIDTNVMVFNQLEWLKLYKDYQIHTKLISAEIWNIMMYPNTKEIGFYFNSFSSEFRDLDIQKIKILCYDKEKPWKKPDIPLGHLWWKEMRNTVFYESVLLKNIPVMNISSPPDKMNTLNLIWNRFDRIYPLAKSYIKENLLLLFTFGKANNKKKLVLLQQKIKDEINK